jgi:hypothetical protein
MIHKLAISLGVLAFGALAGQGVHAQAFSQLPPPEQQVLAPLSGEWDSFTAQRKKKWRDVANRYPSLSPDEQQRLTTRMQGWARMTPEDRRVAREQFREMKKPDTNPPEQREELKRKWGEYRELPAEQRQALRDAQAQRAVVVSPNAEAVKRAGVPPLPPANFVAPGPVMNGPTVAQRPPKLPPATTGLPTR